ncbi:hypothetical protein [Bradyrhizobium diazoefficiens]|uniref:hypothetical protein n=1 Tax=Bradyrhizobium diazoefficiens TaxID=1355477 RepID=UPI0038510090
MNDNAALVVPADTTGEPVGKQHLDKLVGRDCRTAITKNVVDRKRVYTNLPKRSPVHLLQFAERVPSGSKLNRLGVADTARH